MDEIFDTLQYLIDVSNTNTTPIPIEKIHQLCKLVERTTYRGIDAQTKFFYSCMKSINKYFVDVSLVDNGFFLKDIRTYNNSDTVCNILTEFNIDDDNIKLVIFYSDLIAYIFKLLSRSRYKDMIYCKHICMLFSEIREIKLNLQYENIITEIEYNNLLRVSERLSSIILKRDIDDLRYMNITHKMNLDMLKNITIDSEDEYSNFISRNPVIYISEYFNLYFFSDYIIIYACDILADIQFRNSTMKYY